GTMDCAGMHYNVAPKRSDTTGTSGSIQPSCTLAQSLFDTIDCILLPSPKRDLPKHPHSSNPHISGMRVCMWQTPAPVWVLQHPPGRKANAEGASVCPWARNARFRTAL